MVHDPAWPDKAMFAAYLLIVGGTLGLAVEGLRFVGTVNDNLPDGILTAFPHWLSIALAATALVLGLVCLRTQAAVYGYAGAAAGLFSLAYAGLVPLLSVLAIVMLVKSRIEGEETRNDGIKLRADLWPDKAMAASLFMVVGGSVILMQGILIGWGKYEPVVLKDWATLAMVVDIVVGLFCIWAARRVYHLRMPWLGETAAAALAVTLGLVVLGPALALITFVFMRRARRENEFTKHAAGISVDAPAKRKAKRTGKGA